MRKLETFSTQKSRSLCAIMLVVHPTTTRHYIANVYACVCGVSIDTLIHCTCSCSAILALVALAGSRCSRCSSINQFFCNPFLMNHIMKNCTYMY